MKRVYVFSPWLTTGGVELLHQLVDTLNMHGAYASIVYVGGFKEKQIVVIDKKAPDIYQKYYLHYEHDIGKIDSEESVVIIPETIPELVFAIKRSKIVVWWLSVDNYKFAIEQRQYSDDFINWSKRADIIHLAQSAYAINFLKNELNISLQHISYLSDYINDAFFTEERRNIVLYNPAKGYDVLKPIIERHKDIVFFPLHGMTPEQMMLKMRNSKVYIDFGNHPGKDRIPREAAISGCCVITNTKGAAAYFEDVPIPDKYKFEDIEGNEDKIIALIKFIFENYDNCKKDFEDYRQIIRDEKFYFVEDAIEIFGKIIK